MKKNLQYKGLSISFASYTSIFLALIPLIYATNGFNTSQIAFLSSMYTFGAIIQPLFSILTNKIGIRKTLIFNMLFTFIACFNLYISSSYESYVIFVTIYYVFQAPNIGLMDNFLKLISEQKNVSFGKLRAYISAGWGIGTLIVLPFIYLIDEKSVLLLVQVLILTTSYFVYKTIVDESEIKNTVRKIDLSFFRNKKFLKILFLSTIIMGSWSIKSTYQTLLLMEKTNNIAIISVISVVSILMELIIIPKVETLYNHFGYKKLLLIATTSGILLTFGYFFFNSILLIILVASLHGVVCGILIPLNVFKVREILDLKYFNSAMLMMYSIQNLFAFIIISTVISTIYVSYSAEKVFLSLCSVLITVSIYILVNKFD